jgi:benzoyl-CoA reductase/2-hydroxyglutaryl-CoA dehydratase subunit BcrC/BadD/HgdB
VLARAADRRRHERRSELDRLCSRPDCIPEFEYFVSLYADDPTLEIIGNRTGMRPCAILCLQAPIELFWAQGFSPVKIHSGAFASANLTAPRLPALMCPTIKAVLGEMEIDRGLAVAPWVVPLTCDWVVKFKEARGLFGEFSGPVHLLEVPRVKEGARARARWLSEIRELSAFLKSAGGRPLKRQDLLDSIRKMEAARRALSSLSDLRRRRLVPAVWYALVTGTFFLDSPERWTSGLERVAEAIGRRAAAPGRKPSAAVKSADGGSGMPTSYGAGKNPDGGAGGVGETGSGRAAGTGSGRVAEIVSGRAMDGGSGVDSDGGSGRDRDGGGIGVFAESVADRTADDGAGRPEESRLGKDTTDVIAGLAVASGGTGPGSGAGTGAESGRGAGAENETESEGEGGKGSRGVSVTGTRSGDGSGAGAKTRKSPDGVYLTGAPVFFPNFKVLHLLEEAGLRCLGDDLCSSERLFPRHVELSDTSLDGMCAALAEAYHRGCLCPVFAESERRAALIREAADGGEIRGVVFHLLKGCHPYELDSFPLEERITGWGLKFLKIETDYSTEDSRNLLTRLEAFRPTLGV